MFKRLLIPILALMFSVSGLAKEVQPQVVLITGTASGIGKATAEHLIELGHIVYGGDIQYEKNKYLDKIGGHSLDMDVTNPEQVKAGVAKVIGEQGHIDVLLNNAGFGLYGPVEEVTMEDARYQFDVNVFGLAMVTQEVLPHMRERRSGTIINISSMGGKIYMPLGAWYHATKHAVEGFSDCLRLELKEFDIDVVIIEPGAINTNFGNVTAGYLMKYADGTNYGHMMDPYIEMMENLDPSMGSEPIVIAETVEEIINDDTPKTRYARGNMSKFLIRYRDWFGDRAFDRLMTRMFR